MDCDFQLDATLVPDVDAGPADLRFEYLVEKRPKSSLSFGKKIGSYPGSLWLKIVAPRDSFKGLFASLERVDIMSLLALRPNA